MKMPVLGVTSAARSHQCASVVGAVTSTKAGSLQLTGGGRLDRRDRQEDAVLGAEFGDLAPERDRAVIGRLVEFLGIAVSGPHGGGNGRGRPGVACRVDALESGFCPLRHTRRK